MKKFLLAPILLFSLSAWGQTCTTATCTAASVAESDVLAALPSPSNTNATVIVNIPSGTASWTSNLTYTLPSAVKTLTIQGNTAVTCTGTAGTSGYSCTPTDNTIIQDSDSGIQWLWNINISAGTTLLRVTGLTIEGGTGAGNKNQAMLYIVAPAGTTSNVRIDHSHFNTGTYTSPALEGQLIEVNGGIVGVADHNYFDEVNTGVHTAPDLSQTLGVIVFNNFDDTVGEGDGSWNNATGFGTSGFFFIESNYFKGGFPEDCDQSGRYVIRYNYIYQPFNAIRSHGTKTAAGGIRGCRAFEGYQNYIPGGGDQFSAVGPNGGPALVWGNTVNNFYYLTQAGVPRSINQNQNEVNTPNGWGYCGTSTQTATTPFPANGVGSTWDGNSPTTGTPTSTGWPCLDGLGRGQTSQSLNGAAFPGRLNTTTGTVAWPQQMMEPVYLFDNSITTFTGEATINDNSGQMNRDLYFDCGANNSACAGGFTGAAGTGTGLLSARPATCTAGPGGTYGTSPTGSYGVAYWATDANSGNGELYICTATNTWTAVYQPYTYPHPLAAGGIVATPTFLPAAGSYSSPQWVKISTTTPSAICYYTIDGSAPTTSSAIVDHYLWVTSTQTIKSVCAASGLTNSAIGSAAYTITSQPTRFSLSLPNTSTSYAPFPQDNRPPAGSGTDLNSLCPTRGGCVWTTLGNWITQSQANSARTYWTIQKMPTWFTGLGSPENAPASDLTTSALCQAPIATTTDYACRVQEVAASLGEYLTGLSSPPASPQSCSSKLYAIEQTNEFNTNGSSGAPYVGWAGTAAQLATEAYYWNKQMRLWCYDIVEMPGSVSGIDGGSSPISNHFDIAMAAVLAAWPQGQKPDGISEHPYPNNQSQCAAFPTSNVSITSSGCTGGSGYVAITGQINRMNSTSVLQQSATVAWSEALPVLGDEAGFGEIKQVCGSTSCANTDTTTIALKTAWVSEAMISLRQQDAASVLFYLGYDPTGTPCQSTDWGCYRWTAASTDSPWYPGYSQTAAWLAATTAISAPVTTAVTGGTAWTYNATVSGVSGGSAQYAWCDAYLPATCTMSTAFTTYQDITGAVHPTGGGVTLSQTPILLSNQPPQILSGSILISESVGPQP